MNGRGRRQERRDALAQSVRYLPKPVAVAGCRLGITTVRSQFDTSDRASAICALVVASILGCAVPIPKAEAFASAADGGAVAAASVSDVGASHDSKLGGSDEAPSEDSTVTFSELGAEKIKKYETCSTLLDCVSVACELNPGPICPGICVDVASPAASQMFQPLGKCLWAGCYPDRCEDAAAVAVCLGECVQLCASPYFTCKVDGETGSADCADGMECVANCSGPDEAVSDYMADCYRSMKQEGRTSWLAWWASVARPVTMSPMARRMTRAHD